MDVPNIGKNLRISNCELSDLKTKALLGLHVLLAVTKNRDFCAKEKLHARRYLRKTRILFKDLQKRDQNVNLVTNFCKVWKNLYVGCMGETSSRN